MHSGKTIALLLALALGVRLAGIAWWESRLSEPFGFPDSESYWQLAADIATGQPYEYGDAAVFRAPGYPLLLAPVVAIAGSERAGIITARVLSAALMTLAVGGVYWLGCRYQDQRCGLWAAAWCAVSPELVGLGVFVLSEAAFCPLLILHLMLALVAWEEPRPRTSHVWSFGAGVAAGAASLVRPSWLLFVPFAALVGMVLGADRRRHGSLGLTCAAGVCLVMMPWWIRNMHVTGHFVPTTLQVGASLYDGLNPQATGASDMSFGTAEADRFTQQWAAPGNLEYELDRHLRRQAVDWATSHPTSTARLAVVKCLRMWNVWPNEASFRSWPLRLSVFFTYTPVLLLAIAGAWKLRHRGWTTVLLWLPAIYFTLFHMIFAASIRYRQPALLPMAVLGAAALARWRRTASPTQTD